MYQKLIIFFLLYLAGGILSPALASVELELGKNLLYALAEDVAGEGTSLDELLKQLPDFDGDDICPAFASSRLISTRLDDALIFTGSHSLCFQVVSRPLYLLFHSFLFYDFR